MKCWWIVLCVASMSKTRTQSSYLTEEQSWTWAQQVWPVCMCIIFRILIKTSRVEFWLIHSNVLTADQYVKLIFISFNPVFFSIAPNHDIHMIKALYMTFNRTRLSFRWNIFLDWLVRGEKHQEQFWHRSFKLCQTGSYGDNNNSFTYRCNNVVNHNDYSNR